MAEIPVGLVAAFVCKEFSGSVKYPTITIVPQISSTLVLPVCQRDKLVAMFPYA